MSNATTQMSIPLHLENTINVYAKKELQLPAAFLTYREMLLDESIGGGLSLIQNLINKLDFKIKAPKNANTATIKLTDALNKSLDNMEDCNKCNFINRILSMCVYGHSIFEMVFTKNKLHIVFKSFVPVHPVNVKKYWFNKSSLEKIELTTPAQDSFIEQVNKYEVELPTDKILMFMLNADIDNPLGRSLLQRCYMPWKKKQIVSEYELIGVAKNLSGVLKVQVPSEYIQDYYNNPATDNAMYVQDLIMQADNLHGGKASSVLIASDTNENGVRLFDVTTVGNKEGMTNLDTNAILNRLDSNILVTLYTDIMSLGQNIGSSMALSDNKTALLALFLESILVCIQQSFDKAIKQAFLLNNVVTEEYPKLSFEEVEKLDFDTFTRGWQRLVQAGAVTTDEGLEQWIRQQWAAPDVDYNKVIKNTKTADPIDRVEDDKQK